MAPQNHNNELASTNFVAISEQELIRLALLDRLLTAQMGGVLPEQTDQARFQHALDVGCGSGDWLLKGAPERKGIGIDICNRAVQYARAQAQSHHITDRVQFYVMDALDKLAFPDASFDLVNLRLGLSFVRTWEWLKLLIEMRRVACSGGIVRLTEAEVLPTVSSSNALIRLSQLFLCAFDRSGRLFKPVSRGVTDHLAPLLHHIGCRQIQQQAFPLEIRAGTEEGESYAKSITILLKTARPFLQKWCGEPSENYDGLSEQVLREVQQPDFHITWLLHTIWEPSYRNLHSHLAGQEDILKVREQKGETRWKSRGLLIKITGQ